jgi:hypothetical protein
MRHSSIFVESSLTHPAVIRTSGSGTMSGGSRCPGSAHSSSTWANRTPEGSPTCPLRLSGASPCLSAGPLVQAVRSGALSSPYLIVKIDRQD